MVKECLTRPQPLEFYGNNPVIAVGHESPIKPVSFVIFFLDNGEKPNIIAHHTVGLVFLSETFANQG